VGIRFERWQRRPEFSSAIFRMKHTDCATSSALITRKRITKLFANSRGGALSEAEQRTLLEVGKRGFGVGSDREAEKFVAYVQGLHRRMLADRSASPVALAIAGVITNYAIPSNFGRRGRALARASKHPVRDILLGVAGGAFGGLQMSGWNPIGGVVGGVVGGAIAAVEALC
jgi:hypothetical protein